MSKKNIEIKVICGLGGNCNTNYKLRENNGLPSVNTVLDWIKNNSALINDSVSFAIKVTLNKQKCILVLKDTETYKPYNFVNDIYMIKDWFNNNFYINTNVVKLDETSLTYTTYAYKLNNKNK